MNGDKFIKNVKLKLKKKVFIDYMYDGDKPQQSCQ